MSASVKNVAGPVREGLFLVHPGIPGKFVPPLLSLPLSETAVKGATRRFATANGRP